MCALAAQATGALEFEDIGPFEFSPEVTEVEQLSSSYSDSTGGAIADGVDNTFTYRCFAQPTAATIDSFTVTINGLSHPAVGEFSALLYTPQQTVIPLIFRPGLTATTAASTKGGCGGTIHVTVDQAVLCLCGFRLFLSTVMARPS